MWTMQVWNELWGMSYPHPYLDLYNASARALKDVHPTMQVGGPATAGIQDVQAFVDDTKAMGVASPSSRTPAYTPACAASLLSADI